MSDIDRDQLAEVAGGGIPFWGFCHYHPWNKNDLCWDATPFLDKRYIEPAGWRKRADALWKKAFWKQGTY
jgi:hypothetical protein